MTNQSFRDGDVRAVRKRVENNQNVALRRRRRKACLARVNQINHAARRQNDAGNLAPREFIVPDKSADGKGENRNHHGEQRRIRRRRQGQTFEKKKLVENDAEEAEQRKIEIIFAAFERQRAARALQNIKRERRAADPKPDNRKARKRLQSEFPKHRRRAEKHLHRDERDVRRETCFGVFVIFHRGKR